MTKLMNKYALIAVMTTCIAFVFQIIIYKIEYTNAFYDSRNENLFKIDKKKSSKEKLKELKHELSKIKADSNYYYSLNYYDYLSNDKINYSQNLSSYELAQLKNNLQLINDDNYISISGKVNNEVMYSINVFDSFSRYKKSRVNINGVGNIDLCLEDTMELNETYKALLIISKDIKDDFIKNIMNVAFPDGVPKNTKDTMLLSKKIFASLLPVKSGEFTVLRADLDTIKNIDTENKDYITWEWIITPLKVGKSKLVLNLSRVDSPKGELDKFLPSKIIPIHVLAIEKTYSETIFNFIKEEWKFLLTSFLGIIGWILVYKQNQQIKLQEKQQKMQGITTSHSDEGENKDGVNHMETGLPH